MAQAYVEYQEEELRQLEKMYKSGDVNEETEAIVLKRARDQVKWAKSFYEGTRAQCDEMRRLALPRQEEKVKEGVLRSDVEWDRTKLIFPIEMGKRRLELEKQKVQQAQAREHLHKLIEDRTTMTVKAPTDGIVYYGRCVRGKWSGGSETLRRGSGIQANEVFMTIVKPRPLLVRISVPEAQLENICGGLKAVVEPAGREQLLTAIVQHVGTVPLGSGSFDAQLTLATDGLAESLMPGMSCEVKMLPYAKKDALTIPPKAVFTDDLDLQKRYVYVAGKKEKDKPQRRDVTVGKRNDKQVEILSGLSAGEEVLLERPKDEE
jgi:HlyD family secretion protein